MNLNQCIKCQSPTHIKHLDGGVSITCTKCDAPAFRAVLPEHAYQKPPRSPFHLPANSHFQSFGRANYATRESICGVGGARSDHTHPPRKENFDETNRINQAIAVIKALGSPERADQAWTSLFTGPELRTVSSRSPDHCFWSYYTPSSGSGTGYYTVVEASSGLSVPLPGYHTSLDTTVDNVLRRLNGKKDWVLGLCSQPAGGEEWNIFVKSL